jgi:GTP-binding protein HflX
LTRAEVLAEDMLFATLDPTLRGLRLPHGARIMLSDTVGFISDLPTMLVSAFRATLEEVISADVILHVRDISHEDTQAQSSDVELILADLGIRPEDHDRIIEVWNKLDLMDLVDQEAVVGDARRHDPRAVPVSAVTGAGCPDLLVAISALVDDDEPIEVLAPAGDGAAIAWLYRHGRVLDRELEEDGATRMAVKLSAQALGQFERLFPQVELRD